MLRLTHLALLLGVLTGVLSARPAAAESRTSASQASARPVVLGFERLAADRTANPAHADPAKAGRLLLGELNCLSCHQDKQATPANGHKQAPLLGEVGARVRVSYLRKFIQAPAATKPGTTMPDLFADDPDRVAKTEALVQFLATTGSLKQTWPDRKSVPIGEKLYNSVGCVACHGPRDHVGKAIKVKESLVPLGTLAEKYSVASLGAFLENPLHARPSGRMPKVVPGNEARQIASYLLQGARVDDGTRGSTAYAYFEGDWERLPDFKTLKPVATGTAPAFGLQVARRENNYGILFEGYIRVVREGVYQFFTLSDDGTKLYVDGKQVVDNDGIHPPELRSGKITLSAGNHKVAVAFMQGGGGAELEVDVEGPGMGRRDLGQLIVPAEADLDRQPVKPHQPDEDRLDPSPELVARGKELFASVGCANCHRMKPEAAEVKRPLKAAALEHLKGDGGCLAAKPAKGLPWYSLSDTQRTALASALKHPAPVGKDPADVISRVMTTFNCYACHARGGVGGLDVESDLNRYFQTTQPEMGEEGRAPPWLTGVGAKLRPDYLARVLDHGAKDRPYMLTYMPGFGKDNVTGLAEAFVATDHLPEIPPVSFEQPARKVKSTARHLAGSNALGCIKCHTFAGERAEGVQGIDMTIMTERLRRDWFHAYLLDPIKLRPGTRMPTSWPNGKTFFPDVLGGKSVNQIEGLWVYLSDGRAAQAPVGIGKKSIPLTPTDSAILYRNFIQGAGPRGFGVGYPEKANLAFDVNGLRLALVWEGAFIDAGRHWTERGEGYQPPLGDNIIRLPEGPAFAALASPGENWPSAHPKDQPHHFTGYTLTPDDRPTFSYTLGPVKVVDFPNAVAGAEPALKRVLTLTAAKPVERYYFRAATGTKIEPAADGWYAIDGWKMRLESAEKPVIRQSQGKAELLVPVTFADGHAKIVQQFAW